MNKIYQHSNNNNSHRSNAAQGSNTGAGTNNTTTRVGPPTNNAAAPNLTQTTNVPNSNNNNNSNNNHALAGPHHPQQQQQPQQHHHHSHHHHPRQHVHNQNQHQHQHQQQHHHHHQQQQQPQHHHQHHHQQQPHLHPHQHQVQQQVPQQLSTQQAPQQQPQIHNPHQHTQNPAYVPHPTSHITHDALSHQPEHQHLHPQQPSPQQIPPQQVPASALGVTQAPPPQANQQQHPTPPQQQNNQHNPMVKHHPQIPQQASMAGAQIHQQQPHHHHHHHQNHHHHSQQHHHPLHQHQQPQLQMPISPSMPQPHQWVGPHAQLPAQSSHNQHHHHHSQQPTPHPQHHPQQSQTQQQPQSQQQPQPQQQQPQQPPIPPPPHHMTHPTGPQLMLNQQYPGANFIYTQLGGHTYVSPTGHLQQPPYDHPPSTSHQPEPVSVNSQQPVSISSHHPGNLPLNQIPAPAVISTASTGTASVHQINNGPIMEPHMTPNRLPLNQQPHMIPNPYMQAPFNLMVSYPHLNPNLYPYAPPSGHIPPNPTMIPPLRVPADMSIRQQFDPQNATTPIPPNAALGQPQPLAGTKPPIATVPPSQGMISTPVAPVASIKPRPKKALAIVDPRTKHVYTEDELKGSPSTPQSQSSRDSGALEISPKDPSNSDNNSSINDDMLTKSIADSTSSEKPSLSISEEPSSASEVVMDSKIAESTELKQPTDVAQPASPKQGSTTVPPVIQPAISPQPNLQKPVQSQVQPQSLPQTHTQSQSQPQQQHQTPTETQVIPQTPLQTKPLTPPPKQPQLQSKPLPPSSNQPKIQPHVAAQTSIDQPQSTSVPIKEKVLANGESNLKPDEKVDASVKDITEGAAAITISVNDEKQTDELEETPVKKKTLPDLPYKAGQYSPLNPDGARKYTPEFLKAVAKKMKIEVDPMANPAPRIDFAPHFMSNQTSGNYGRDYSSSQMPLMRRSSQQVINKPRKIITTHSLQQEVELKTAEKPWKPELETEKTKIVESGVLDTERLLKVFRGHLNKLTPQKYDSLIEKIHALDLNGSDRLNRVIDLVFDKAVDEPGFCELYARMCKVIAAKDNEFCFHLVKKCQDEFETSDLYDGLNVEERQLEIEQETDINKKKLMSEELYEDMRLRRKKYLGTIKLIGEMYKLGLLLPKIIGFCMLHLKNDPTNENIECLCSLIATVGAKMASEPEPAITDALNTTVQTLAAFAHSKKVDENFVLESRIKFKILDTIDLSRRNWKPRMVENNPKKIEELREEAKEESLRQHHHQNHSGLGKNMSKSDDRDRNRRQPSQYSFSKSSGGKW